MTIFQQIESLWFDAAAAAIVAHAARFPSERFYAGAFWLCYVDYSRFGTPAFALNTESHFAANRSDEAENLLRWFPSDWQFPVIDETVERMAPRYEALSRSLAGQSEAVWDTVIKEHSQTLARVCRKLTRLARDRCDPFTQVTLPPDFVVGIFDGQESEPTFSALVRASIAPEILSTLPSPLWETA